MKKMIFALTAAGLAAASCGSCKCRNAETVEVAETVPAGDEIMGDCAPLKLSVQSLTFPRKGGSATVICHNCDRWWISDIEEHDTGRYSLADPGADDSYRTVKAEGISAEITADNEVRVTVAPGREACRWSLHMQSGDAFATIRIQRKGRNAD